MDDCKTEILINPDPLPLEQTDPVIAEHLRLIANRIHPMIRRLSITQESITIDQHNGVLKILRLLERNDPCPCGSGKKWKKCHGR